MYLSVSISLAHLHPDFGKKTSAEILAEMKKEDEEGEVDVNAEEYRELRNRARQSPYPSLVLEVMASSGQEVKKGDALLILEAMKMENVIKAQGDGIVKEVQIEKGQTVDKGAILVEME